MERWELKLLESVGSITFGMDRGEVRKRLGDPVTVFRKGKWSKNTTDDYGRFHVFYTPDDRVEAVEFHKGVEIVLNGQTVFPIKTKEIEKVLPGIEKEGDFFTSIENSIAYQTNPVDAECFLAAGAGYYA